MEKIKNFWPLECMSLGPCGAVNRLMSLIENAIVPYIHDKIFHIHEIF